METSIKNNLFDPTRNYQPTMEEMKAADDFASIIVLSQGKLINGAPYYAYIAIPPSKYQFFKLAEAQGSFTLGDYGVILKFECVAEPSDAVKKEMEKAFGLDHEFEVKIKKMLEESGN